MATTKKTYYYTITSQKSSGYGGTKTTAAVYHAKGSLIKYVGEVKWNTASFKNESSVVYDLLMDKKLVTAKEYKDNGGYFRSRTSKVNIERL